MKLIYTEIKDDFGGLSIKAEYDNGLVLLIPTDPTNSDYQRYLRWLENPEADEAQSL